MSSYSNTCDDPCAPVDPCAQQSQGSFSFGSSNISSQDNCDDPCAPADPCAQQSQGSFSSGSSNISSQDQCVDPCAKVVPACDPVMPRMQQTAQEQPDSSSSSTTDVGAAVTIRSGRMINGQFVPSRVAPFETTSSQKKASSIKVGGELRQLHPATSAKGFKQRQEALVGSKASSSNQNALATFQERLEARRKARNLTQQQRETLYPNTASGATKAVGEEINEAANQKVRETERRIAENLKKHPLQRKSPHIQGELKNTASNTNIGCGTCGMKKKSAQTGHSEDKKDKGFESDSDSDDESDMSGEISF